MLWSGQWENDKVLGGCVEGEEAFSNWFVDLCRLPLASNDTIAELCVSQPESSSHGWDLQFYRNLHECELESFVNLSLVLDQVRLNEELTDLKIWKPDRS